jgi:PadR family transcriptional regulator PadR
MRLTNATVQVVLALLDDTVDVHYGYDLGKRARVRTGVLYPILQRMLQEGWLEDHWEDVDASRGRPPRRYYTVTDAGRYHLVGMSEQARVDERFAALIGFVGA